MITLAGFTACKPKIDFAVLPEAFCGCTAGTVSYTIKKAASAKLTRSPGDHPQISLDLHAQIIAIDSICETSTFILIAKNSNGQVSASRVVTRVDSVPSYSQLMEPCGSGVDWESLTDATALPVENTEITFVEFEPDRDGTLLYNGLSVPVRAGHNELTEFEGRVIRNEIYFAAPLRITETCAPSTSSPDSRVKPPSFNITFHLRCRR